MQKIIITPIRNESEIPNLKKEYCEELERKGYTVSSVDIMFYKEPYCSMIISYDDPLEISMFINISQYESDAKCRVCFEAENKESGNEVYAYAVVTSGICEERHRLKIANVGNDYYKVIPLTFDEGIVIIETDIIAEILESDQEILKSIYVTVNMLRKKGV